MTEFSESIEPDAYLGEVDQSYLEWLVTRDVLKDDRPSSVEDELNRHDDRKAYGLAPELEQLDNRYFAESSAWEGRTVPFVRLGDRAIGHDRSLLYIPDLAEGIEDTAPLAVVLASRGADVILPARSRTEIAQDPEVSTPEVAYLQAQDYLDVLCETDTDIQPWRTIDVVTHGQGNRVFEEMQKIAAEKGLPYLEGSRVVTLPEQPAARHEKGVFGLVRRFLRGGREEAVQATPELGLIAIAGDAEMSEVAKMFRAHGSGDMDLPLWVTPVSEQLLQGESYRGREAVRKDPSLVANEVMALLNPKAPLRPVPGRSAKDIL
jgi:hypothetical protein